MHVSVDTAPSADTATAQPETAVGGATHVHWAGQSLEALQSIALASQCDVVRAVQLQVGGATPASSPGGIGATGSAGAMLEPGGVATVPLPPDPADPAHSHWVSGTQVNPAPQSLSTLHGGTYLGTHVFTVVVVHDPASTAGSAQGSPGGHAGVEAPEQFTCV